MQYFCTMFYKSNEKHIYKENAGLYYLNILMKKDALVTLIKIS